MKYKRMNKNCKIKIKKNSENENQKIRNTQATSGQLTDSY